MFQYKLRVPYVLIRMIMERSVINGAACSHCRARSQSVAVSEVFL